MKEEDRDRGALVDYRLQRARETLRDAHLLCERKGSLWSVINRAYYAMFYAVLALLTSVGKGASKHSGVLTLFDEHFIKPGHLSREMSKAIHKAFELRQIGDYRELATLMKSKQQKYSLWRMSLSIKPTNSYTEAKTASDQRAHTPGLSNE